MSELLIGLLGVLLATNQVAAATNLITKKTGVKLEVVDPNNPVEKEYQKILEEDDAAQEEVDKWIQEKNALASQDADLANATLSLRIDQRFRPVRKAYEDFLLRQPKHARALLAYGSFLSDTGDEAAAKDQWEKARGLDPTNPATWNNLANYYGHRGPTTNAFAYYEKAIALRTNEPVYYQNFATTVFLFRKDAQEFYKINEQQVFDRALELYRQALKLDPNNFPLATDLAQTYYGIKPPRHDEALAAWNYALKIASDDIEREGIYVHLARLQIQSGRFAEARTNLNLVANPQYGALKQRLVRNLENKEAKPNEPGEAQADAAKKP